MALKLKFGKPRKKKYVLLVELQTPLRHFYRWTVRKMLATFNSFLVLIKGTRKLYRGPLRVHRPHFNSHCSIWYTFWATPLYHIQGFCDVSVVRVTPNFIIYLSKNAWPWKWKHIKFPNAGSYSPVTFQKTDIRSSRHRCLTGSRFMASNRRHRTSVRQFTGSRLRCSMLFLSPLQTMKLGHHRVLPHPVQQLPVRRAMTVPPHKSRRRRTYRTESVEHKLGRRRLLKQWWTGTSAQQPLFVVTAAQQLPSANLKHVLFGLMSRLSGGWRRFPP